MEQIALITFIDPVLPSVACESEAIAISSLKISYSRSGSIQTLPLNGSTAVFNRDRLVATIQLISFMTEPDHL